MKKILLLIVVAILAILPATAQLTGDGYYRVRNSRSKRTVYVTDNKGSVDYAATTADVGALEVWSNPDRVVSDPSSILYFEKHGDLWDILGSGTGVSKIISAYVNILYQASTKTYLCYGSKAGLSKYLGDVDTSSDDQGIVSVDAKGDSRKWEIIPVNANTDSYFGIKPTISVGGRHFSPFYADFPFSAHSAGMKFYTITKVDKGYAVISEVSGTIAKSVPVIIECSSTSPASNRLSIGGNGSTPSGNLLGGVYFNNKSKLHYNRTKFDPATMRILGVGSDGKLAYISPSLDFLPANQSYLKVPANTPAELKIVTAEEYETLTAQPTGISLSKTEVTAIAGESFKLTATITPSQLSDSPIAWSSSNTAIATVDGSGQVKTIAPGSAIITATTQNGLKAECRLTVIRHPESVTLSKTAAQIYPGDSFTLTANVLPADASDKTVSWKSSNPGIASVDANGKVTGVAPGNCQIIVTTHNGKSASCEITVVRRPIPVSSVTISHSELSLTEGDTFTLTASVNPADADNQTITWTSSNPAVATVDSKGGVTAIAPGSATVTATAEGKSASCKVTVTRRPIPVSSVTISRSELSLTAGDTFTLTANVLPANADNKTITWSSSNPAVATVAPNGFVTAISAGTATISATAGGKSASCVVTVTRRPVPVASITISKSQLSLTEGDTYTLTAHVNPADADNQTVTWNITNPAVATIDSNGLVTAISAGSAIVTATAEGKVASCLVTVVRRSIDVESVSISKTEAEITAGDTLQLSARVNPENADNPNLKWKSSDTEIAIVDNEGLVTALSEGVVTITAFANNGKSASCQVTVKRRILYAETITLSASSLELIVNEESQLSATVFPEEAVDKEVSWESSDPSVVTVTTDGKLTAIAEGKAVITASAGKARAECQVTVTNPNSGIENILGSTGSADVYNLQGILIKRRATAADLMLLPSGLYILNGKLVKLTLK